MALDGILLYKIIPEIAASVPMRIQKIWQISSTEVLFQTHSPKNGKQQLLVSTHSVYNRFLFTKRSYPTPAEPGNFVMVLRKHLEGGIIESIEQAGLDRWCTLTIRHRNDLGDLETLYLYIELMGKYANMILVNTEGRIIDALKKIPPFENTRRTILPGAQFEPTPPQDKNDPFTNFVINPEQSLTKQFSGFSPFLSKEVEYRMARGQSFQSIMEEIANSKSLYIANDNEEAVFHCIPLTMLGTYREYPLLEGFDILYYHKEEKDRIRQISGDIYHFVKRELKHQKQKLPRLYQELDDAQNCERYRLYGDLLFTYQIKDTKGKNEITLQSYEDESMVKIPLDVRLDGFANAKKHYQKYNKLKKAQTHLLKQIEICENEIAYFTGLIEQLDQADFLTASEIRDELIHQGYIQEKRKSTQKKQKKKKNALPNLSHMTLKNGTEITFGKNNLQNDALTWHIAKKDEYWFHAKDYHGSHVVVHSSTPDEETIRIAAMIAAYYSAGRQSSSVPVQWCQVRTLKKIPGAKPGMVQLSNYKTIYIDPDEEFLIENGIDIH